MEIVKRGKRVVYEPEAISEEEPSVSYDKELNRKVRIQTRSIQGVFHMRCLLNPFRYGIFSIQLLVHKAFRYLIPIFLLSGALSLGFLTHKPFYFMLFCFMIISLFMAAIAKFTENRPSKGRLLKIFNLIYYYLVVNYALVLAWVNVLKGGQILVWSTERDHISH
jgi:cellulose synthase/poly-beta-1,6-N-acetylglucosamine synthase-like glycosyltransferase